MLMLSVPMCVFYEISILIGSFIAKRRAAPGGVTPAPPAPRPAASGSGAPVPLRARRLPAPGGRRPSTPARRCWWPRPPGRARPWWPSTPWPGRWPRAARPSTRRRSRPCRTRSSPTWPAGTAPATSGLLTGDNSINGDAPVVVMTTEVLRNMIYAGSPALDGPALRGARRGPLPAGHLPRPGVGGGHHPPAARRCALVCLSATVSNAEELADWLTTVRGPTRLVLEERRPVELRNLYLVGDRQSEQPHLLPTLVDGRPNPEAERLDDAVGRPARRPPAGPPAAPAPAVHAAAARRRSSCSTSATCCPRSTSSSAGPAATTPCAPCLDAGLRLTTPDERHPHPGDRRGAHRGAHRRRPRRARATTAGSPASRRASPPTTPAWCRRSRRRSRRASPRAWSRWCSPPRRWPSASTCRPASVVIEKLTKFTGERHERSSRRASTPSSPGGPGAGASTTSATPSCCGRRSCPSTRWRRWRPAAPTACAPPSGRPTTWPPTWCAATSRPRPTTC